MIPFKTLVGDMENEKIILDILHWSEGKEKVLNLVSIPYNSSIIFVDVILRYASKKQKILYITGETGDKLEIIDCIKRFSLFRDYMYIRKNTIYNISKTSLYVTSYENAINVLEQFDLIIYDDLISFSHHSKYEILDLIASISTEGTKIICRSVESVFQNATSIEIPSRDCKMPFAEPRIINTRIDINKDIPYVVYEYLSWSIDSERKVVIYVPDEERGTNVYKYLLNFREILHNNIIYFNEKSNMKYLSNFMKNKRGIIVSDFFSEISMELKDTDIMIYFADDKKFDYKKLIYICAKVGKSASLGNGEVIFLARETTKDMDLAKDMARSFNKQAWEMGLLNI